MIKHALVRPQADVLRYSLVTVWLGAAATSAIGFSGISRELLEAGGMHDDAVNSGIIAAGIAADFTLGLLLWFRPCHITYQLALGMVVIMTLAATWVDATLWLHPLGPLIKNLPIAALLWALAKEEAR